MKRIIFLLVCILFIHIASAQWSNKWLSHTNHKHLLYTHGDVMVGTNSGGNLGMSFVYNRKYSVELGFSASSNKVLPAFPGMLKSASISESADIIASPEEMLENYHMMVGRHFYLNSKGTFRLVVQGGPGVSVVNTKSAVTKSTGYTVIPTVRTSDFSVMMNSKFEFPISKLIGFSAGPTLLVNHERKYFTMGVGFIYGIISKN
jgi:hypothetical protein